MTSTEVIIPTRNAPEILWLTLTHFFTFALSEEVKKVTILDNRSTAVGMTEVLRFAQRCGAHVIRHEQNVGVWTSINRGLALARSDRVFVLTADVLLAPGTVSALGKVMDASSIPFLGPWVTSGIQATPCLADLYPEVSVDTTKYNGACWLMDWKRLQKEIGWFDPQFYICAGDTDYIERMKLANIDYGMITLPCVHLDKQSRRHDMTAQADSEMEASDMGRFREKWKDHPEVLERHPTVDVESWSLMKGGDAGWKAAIPR